MSIEIPPNISCPECGTTEHSCDPEGACTCKNGHVFWDTNAWEWKTLRRAEAAEARLRRLQDIIDRPDPHDFITASVKEARYQMQLWGTTEGFPTAFDNTDDPAFVYLIAYLVGKVAATPEDTDSTLEKKLHRVTTIAAAAANWHLVISSR